MSKRPKIVDVARLAGVSTATVSRAIHSPEVVSDATLKAVSEAIAQTGYTLNVAAQNLRRQRANAVLVLVPDIGNTFFSEILSGIESVASRAGQTILIGDAGQSQQTADKFLQALLNNQADGALLLNGRLSPAWHERLETAPESYHVVSISEALSPPAPAHVGIDNAAAFALATDHLISHGHTDIALLNGPEGSILSHHRHEGFVQAMTAAGLAIAEDRLFTGDFTIRGGIKAAEQILASPRRPTAVACANDEMAMGLMSRLASGGVSVPDEISVIGFDDIAFASVAQPPLTTIRQPRFDMGARAMEVLLEMINGKAADAPALEMFDAKLISRGSVGPKPA